MGRGVSEAWEVMATMISGILVWGGIGLLVDLRLGFRWLLLPVGMLLGTAVAIALVWLKHGRDDGAT
jgi:F0F1-type ATP synthase assembly protein I